MDKLKRQFYKTLDNNGLTNKSMDVRAKQRLSYQCHLLILDGLGSGFAPRHLNRSALVLKITQLKAEDVEFTDQPI